MTIPGIEELLEGKEALEKVAKLKEPRLEFIDREEQDLILSYREMLRERKDNNAA